MANNAVCANKLARAHCQPEMTARDIMGMVMGFQQTQIVYTAGSLGVFDELNKSSCAMTAQALANRVCTDPDATERLLNACVGLGLLTKHTVTAHKSEEEVYSNTPVADQFLVKTSPMSLRPVLANINSMYRLFGQLTHGVRNGQSQITSLGNPSMPSECQLTKTEPPSECPQPAADLMFSEAGGFYSSSSIQTDFLHAMHFFSKFDAPHVITAFDLTEFDTACDLGGGTGTLGVALAESRPDLHVVVADLSHMLDVAQHFTPQPQPPNLTFQPSDFFKDTLPPADLYILSHVIHDWDDACVDKLLERVYDALPPGGGLLVLEKTLTEAKDGPLPALMFDISMMLGAKGRERSASEYRTLLQKHHFCDVKVKVLPPMVHRDAILARKW